MLLNWTLLHVLAVLSHPQAVYSLCVHIQSDSGGKLIFLGGDSIGHCVKKINVNMCLILNGYRDRAV